jgi:hypothetical protein
MTKRKPIRGQLTAEAMIVISERILAKERAWRAALGVPRGLLVPDKPLPALGGLPPSCRVSQSRRYSSISRSSFRSRSQSSGCS